MSNPLGMYDLNSVWVSEGVGSWRVNCRRCGITAQTSKEGPYKSSPDLTMLIHRHICDPNKRGNSNGTN